MNNLILTAILLVAFFMCIAAYCLGHKHRQMLIDGKIPKDNMNPVKPIIAAVKKYEQEKETKQAEEELTDIMNYSVETAINAAKKVK